MLAASIAGMILMLATDAFGANHETEVMGCLVSKDRQSLVRQGENSESTLGSHVRQVDPRGRISIRRGSTGRTETRWMRVTAYTCGPESTGKRPGQRGYGITASGAKAVGHCIAADPAIRFGTRIFVPGYGDGRVLDRGGAIRGDRLDVLLPTHKSAKAWGVRWLKVTIYR